jgi:hypothetical protein
MKRRFRAPGPALVISLVALFVALGGTTYAATSLPKNSVGTAQLKKGAVTKKKINKKTIASLKGARGLQGTNGVSVTSTALAAGNAHCAAGGSSFTSASGTTYACSGAKGAKGDKGDTGPTAGATTGGLDPSATPIVVLGSSAATVTTTTTSSLLVIGSGFMNLSCQGSGACHDVWGLYVDGTPVPGTGQELSAGPSGSDSSYMFLAGMTGPLAPGAHSVVFKDDAAGPWSSLGYSNAKVVAVALGGGVAALAKNKQGSAAQSAQVHR